MAVENLGLIFLVTFVSFYIWSIRTAMRGRKVILRSLAAIEAIPEAAARAAEMGKPVHYTTGLTGTTTMDAGQTIAGLSILGKVALECGKFGVPLRFSCGISYLIPVVQDLIRQGYLEGGRPEMYNDDMVVYTTEQQRAFMSSTNSYLLGTKPAVNMFFGAAYWESTTLIGAGATAGCMQIFGVSRPASMVLSVCACDYTLLGEELFAGAAFVDKRPHQLATIQTNDWIKLILIVIIVIGMVAAASGHKEINNLLRW